MKKLNLIACKMVKCYNPSIRGEWKRHIRILYELKFPETLRSHRSYTYDAYGKVKEIKDHRNLLNNSDQAV